MRNYEQKQLLELITTLKEAQSSGMYADCQDGAVFMGEFIEEIMGEGTQTVGLLEEYHDLLYIVSIGEATEEALENQLIKVENSIKRELIPNRVEMAFLSYKASMSDSLESIYLSAKADPNCDAYWIPIPYFKRNNDGTAGEIQFEGMEHYDDRFECVDWQKYDIAARRPDAIFTFAPYDGGNYVTSVHPNFYCERLRNFTDMLVYVPYFVSSENVSDTFCVVAGCIYAHKVIVQSEKIREVYIRHIKEVYGDKIEKLEDKFVALGSPKFDKVINSKKEDFILPDEWVELINDRKVVLYNTSITPMLQGNEQYLRKLRHVMNMFRNQQEITLWWRPHPLGEATYAGMRPQFIDEYRQIVDNYKKEAWGIYDDTSDLHRAITWSDAYYGDPSSLVTLYEVTGKPVMIQDAGITSDELSIPFSVMHITEDYIWFSVRYINAFFRLKRSDWDLEFMGSFPSEKDVTGTINSLYTMIAENNFTLYFAPFLAKEIATYSLNDNTFSKIPFERHGSGAELNRAFAGAVSYDKYVFFTPCSYPAIMRLDTETNEITYYSDWVEPLKKLSYDSNDEFFVGAPLIVGDTIWLASCSANAVLSFDMASCTDRVYEVGAKGYRFHSILFDGKYFWISPPQGPITPIVKWDPLESVIKEYPEVFDYINPKSEAYDCRFFNGFLWLLPIFGKQVIKVDVRTDKFYVAEEFDDSHTSGLKFISFAKQGDSVFMYHELRRTLIEYNCLTGKILEEKVHYSPEILAILENLLKQLLLSNQGISRHNETGVLFNESGVISLTRFLSESLLNTNNETCKSTEPDNNGKEGALIYRHIKQRLF